MNIAKLRIFSQNARNTLRDAVRQQYKLLSTARSPIPAVLPGKAGAQAEQKAQHAPQALETLKTQYLNLGETEFAERMACTWFNRLCALRFLDLNGYYQGFMAVSPRGLGNSGVPEILSAAVQGLFEPEVIPPQVQQQIRVLLTEDHSQADDLAEVYRLLLLSVCAYWHQYLPFLFEAVSDSTYLLLPDRLLEPHSLLYSLQEALDPQTCSNAEVPGWLYQFYIAERKAQVYADLKQGIRISTTSLPAVTQIFTPHWIVRFLAENSLGRLWLLNHPASKLKAELPFFMAPLKEQESLPFIRLRTPRNLRICDPCCGSGHMLAYAFELLSKIYAEEGYLPEESAALILKHNLFGLEIDERAGALAAFALCLKARALDRGFFRRKILPQICVLKNLSFSNPELEELPEQLPDQLPNPFTPKLKYTLQHLFEHASSQGSLIRIPKALSALLPALKKVQLSLPATEKNRTVPDVKGDQAYKPERIPDPEAEATPEKLSNPSNPGLKARLDSFIIAAELLSSDYDVIITNPPYLSKQNLDTTLAAWLTAQYPEGKNDLCTAFLERVSELLKPEGYNAMLTMQSWMFLSSYTSLRKKVLAENTVIALAHLGSGAFDSVPGEVVQTEAHILQKIPACNTRGIFLKLTEGSGERAKEHLFFSRQDLGFRRNQANFKCIPGSPLSYWLSDALYALCSSRPVLGQKCRTANGLNTGDNQRFLRYWHEVSSRRIGFNESCTCAQGNGCTPCKWFPCNKGGGNRRWYGNQEYVVNWEDDGRALRNFRDKKGKLRSVIRTPEFYFREAVSWTLISSSVHAFRYYPPGFIFVSAAPSLFAPSSSELYTRLGFLNSALAGVLTKALNPTVSLPNGTLNRLPDIEIKSTRYLKLVKACVEITRDDWDSQETSWNFTENPLLRFKDGGKIKSAWENLKALSLKQTQRLQELETENNRIINHELGLEALISPEVPRSEITLFCNPAYRYKDKKDKEEQWRLYRAGIIRDFISWATGCMFGRFAPDKPGLILASKGAGLEDYYAQIPMPLVTPCADNILPFYHGGYAGGDIVQRFKDFVKVIFGAEHYEENLKFIEDSLNPAAAAKERHHTLRDYFYHDFYQEHVRRYHGRPIYWMFSSAKGNFQALIYMHRWTQDTAGQILTGYLRPYIAWLHQQADSLKSALSVPGLSPAELAAARALLVRYGNEVKELEAYELTLLNLSRERIELNLDEGVKINYLKFGSVLKPIPGISAVKIKKIKTGKLS